LGFGTTRRHDETEDEPGGQHGSREPHAAASGARSISMAAIFRQPSIVCN